MSLFRKALLVNTSEIASLALGVSQSILLARLLGPTGVGQYTVAVSAMALAAQLFSFGLPLSFLYHSQRARRRAGEFLASTIAVGLPLSLVGGVLLVVVMVAMPRYFGPVPAYALVGVALYVPIVLARVVVRNVLLLDIEAKRLGVLSIVSVAGGVLWIAVFYALGRFDVPVAILSFVAGPLVGALIGYRWVQGRPGLAGRPGWSTSKEVLGMGIRQSGADLMVLANAQLGVILVRLLKADFASVGYFSRGQSIALLVVTAGQSVLPLLFSRWASIDLESLPGHVERVMRFVSTAGLIAIGGVLVLGNWIIVTMYGPTFLPAVGPMKIMVAGAVLYLLARALMQVLGSKGIPEGSALILLGSSALCALLSWILVPRMGVDGAAWAMSAGNLALVVLLFAVVRARFGVRIGRCWWLRPDDIRMAAEGLSSRGRNKAMECTAAS